jgi:hypothetical protein
MLTPLPDGLHIEMRGLQQHPGVFATLDDFILPWAPCTMGAGR